MLKTALFKQPRLPALFPCFKCHVFLMGNVHININIDVAIPIHQCLKDFFRLGLLGRKGLGQRTEGMRACVQCRKALWVQRRYIYAGIKAPIYLDTSTILTLQWQLIHHIHPPPGHSKTHPNAGTLSLMKPIVREYLRGEEAYLLWCPLQSSISMNYYYQYYYHRD